jgi:DNA invertase Pin-like site-specific DNA recombinase
MKRAALYLRVSTVDQHPETQLHDLRQLAQQRGLEIVATYTDHISSTKVRRPKLEQMLVDARQGKFEVLLVWACDRLARSVRHFLEVLDELNHLGVEFVSFREQLDTGGPLGRAVVVIISVVAELERNLIVERVKAGDATGEAGRPADWPTRVPGRCRRLGARPRIRAQPQRAGEALRDRPNHRAETPEPGNECPAKRVAAIALASS